MSWRDSIQICMDVPTEVCNAKGGNCDNCSIDRVLEALKTKGDARFIPGVIQATDNSMLNITVPNVKGIWAFIPEEAE